MKAVTRMLTSQTLTRDCSQCRAWQNHAADQTKPFSTSTFVFTLTISYRKQIQFWILYQRGLSSQESHFSRHWGRYNAFYVTNGNIHDVTNISSRNQQQGDFSVGADDVGWAVVSGITEYSAICWA